MARTQDNLFRLPRRNGGDKPFGENVKSVVQWIIVRRNRDFSLIASRQDGKRVWLVEPSNERGISVNKSPKDYGHNTKTFFKLGRDQELGKALSIRWDNPRSGHGLLVLVGTAPVRIDTVAEQLLAQNWQKMNFQEIGEVAMGEHEQEIGEVVMGEHEAILLRAIKAAARRAVLRMELEDRRGSRDALPLDQNDVHLAETTANEIATGALDLGEAHPKARQALFVLACDARRYPTAATGRPIDAADVDGTRRALDELIASLNGGDVPILSQSSAIGWGIDVFGAMTLDNILTRCAITDADGYDVIHYLDQVFRVPKSVAFIEDTGSQVFSQFAVSRAELEERLSAEAGIEGKYGLFSAEISAEYEHEKRSVAEQKLSVRHATLRYGRLALIDGGYKVSPELLSDVENLPNSPFDDNFYPFQRFFENYGAYFISQITLGGRIELNVSTSITDRQSDESIEASVEAQYKGLLVSGKIDSKISASEEWKSFTENSTVVMRVGGGDPAKALRLHDLIESAPFSPSAESAAAYAAWVETVAGDPVAAAFRYTGIWELCGPRRDLVKTAFDEYVKRVRPVLSMSLKKYGRVEPDHAIRINDTRLTPDLVGEPNESVAGLVVVFKGDVTSPDNIIKNKAFMNGHFDSFAEAVNSVPDEASCVCLYFDAANNQRYIETMREWGRRFGGDADLDAALTAASDIVASFCLCGRPNAEAGTAAFAFYESPGTLEAFELHFGLTRDQTEGTYGIFVREWLGMRPFKMG